MRRVSTSRRCGKSSGISSVILARRAALCYTIHEIRAARKRTRHPSAPQNGILRQAQQGFHAQGFQNHIPVRGRKLLWVDLYILYCGNQFQNHIPVRGRNRCSMIIEIHGYGKAVFLEEKLTQYALNPLKDRHKAAAFRLALGYQLHDADELMRNVAAHINDFPAVEKPDNGYGKRFHILMELTGKNGKTAKVMTAWIRDKHTEIIRLTSIYVKE